MELPIVSNYNNDTIKQKTFTYNKITYDILRYVKDKITCENYNTLGMFRSVIYIKGKLVCFSPPKSFDIDLFKSRVYPYSMITVEEYVEGTMINVFWNGFDWEIATRSSVGGNVSFYEKISGSKSCKGKTFRQMFFDTLQYHDTNKEFFTTLNNMPKTYCFSFVLQHPENKIVTPFTQPHLYLVKTYDISIMGLIQEVSNEGKFPSWVKYPKKTDININNFDTIMTTMSNEYTDVGVMISGTDSKTHSTIRTKIRNQEYEKVKRLRGNQPKLQYQYLMLRTKQNIAEYLKYYPEHSSMFNIYKDQTQSFIKELHNNYFSCYIKKLKPLKEFSPKFRTHMFKLHELYKNHLSKNNKIVNKNVVDIYVNNMPASLLMSSINYQNI